MWLTKNSSDHDLVCTGPREVIRRKAVRKVNETLDAEAILAMEVGPWDLRKGVHTQMKVVRRLSALTYAPELRGSRDVDIACFPSVLTSPESPWKVVLTIFPFTSL